MAKSVTAKSRLREAEAAAALSDLIGLVRWIKVPHYIVTAQPRGL